MIKTTALFFIITFMNLNVYGAEKSLYDFKWLDDGETVYVIQNKEHVKSGKVAFDVSLMGSNSSPYQDSSGLSFSLTYYFSENWSIDFAHKSYTNEDGADLKNLLNAYENEVKPLIRKVNIAKLLHVNWIPFYGKINTFNKIFFFDWGVGLGIGQFDTSGNYKTFKQKNISITFVDEVDMGFNIRSFVKVYTRSNFTMGFEYNLSGVNTIKRADGVKEIMYYNDTILTVGYMF